MMRTNITRFFNNRKQKKEETCPGQLNKELDTPRTMTSIKLQDSISNIELKTPRNQYLDKSGYKLSNNDDNEVFIFI